jgi:hypothetical protein
MLSELWQLLVDYGFYALLPVIFAACVAICYACMTAGGWLIDRVVDTQCVECYEPSEPGDVYEVIYKKAGQTFRFSFYDHQRWAIWLRVMDYAANDDCVLTWHDVAILRPKIKPWLGRIDRGDLPAEVDDFGGDYATDDDLR